MKNKKILDNRMKTKWIGRIDQDSLEDLEEEFLEHDVFDEKEEKRNIQRKVSKNHIFER